VQLNEIRESSSLCQSGAALEVVPEFPAMTDTEGPTSDVETLVEPAAEPRMLSMTRTKSQWFSHKVLLLDNDNPATYTEAMMGHYSIKWQDAMKSKIESMYENQVWNLENPPKGVKPIEYKWINKKKIDTDGNVNIHKA
jgi:hypothetical protein